MGIFLVGCGSGAGIGADGGAGRNGEAGGGAGGTGVAGVTGGAGNRAIDDAGGAGSPEAFDDGGGSVGGGSTSGSAGGSGGNEPPGDGATEPPSSSDGAAVDAGAPDVVVVASTSPWPALARPAVTLSGGSAISAGGTARPGGSVHLISKGAMSLDPALVSPQAPDVPAAPADASAVTAAALAADLVVVGAATIDGTILAGGTDAVRAVTAGGDIYVRGTLRAADLGGARQGLTLKSLAGTIYVVGVVDASGAAGSGQAGGALTLVAQRIVIGGRVLSAGGSGALAGNAGAITFTVTAGVSLSGTIDASGGDALGPAAATGGLGGAVDIQAGGDVVLGGPVVVRGGAATSLASDARGGAGGVVTINCDSAVTFAATLDGRGGIAKAEVAGGSVTGGAAGGLALGETAAPATVSVLVPLLVLGGDGVAVGGGGGTARLEPRGGDLRLAGVLDVSGGDSAAEPGVGGAIDGDPGPTTPDATGIEGVDIAGSVVSNGGSITPGGNGDGAAGGVIKLLVQSSDGDMTLEPTGLVQLNGGVSRGSAAAGGGGVMYLFTMDGNASLHGNLTARGGAALDPGGLGGGGGFIYVFTDNNHGGTHGGALIIETDGVIDASGGSGTVGGSARSDGRPHAVATWPVVQTDEFDVEQVAVLINSDGRHGAATGYIDNRGHIAARGGHANGAGGDVQFHGKRQDGNETPLSGAVDMSGDGTGAAGDYAGE